MGFPTFGDGNEKIIPNFRELEWEAGIPGNGREREFLVTPVPGQIVDDKRQKEMSLHTGSLTIISPTWRFPTHPIPIYIPLIAFCATSVSVALMI